MLYDDGHLIEGAAGTLAELGGVRSGDFEIVWDAAGIPSARARRPMGVPGLCRARRPIRRPRDRLRHAAIESLIIDASTQARPDDLVIPAADHVVLALLKLSVGVGRVRRGEVVNGGQFIHTYAVTHLCHAFRARHGSATTSVDARLDPVRRIEHDHPAFGASLAAALSQPPEAAARGVYDLLRSTLEPGWDGVPDGRRRRHRRAPRLDLSA